MTLGGGVGERTSSSLLWMVEVGQAAAGLGLAASALGEVSAGGVDVVGCLADGGLVASGPAAPELFVERGLAVCQLLFGVVSGHGASTQRLASVVALMADVGWKRRFDGGELPGEVAAADAQWFDRMGAQPVLLVDEMLDDLIEPDSAQVGVTPTHPTFQPGTDLGADLGGFGLPTIDNVAGVAVWSLAGRVANDARPFTGIFGAIIPSRSGGAFWDAPAPLRRQR